MRKGRIAKNTFASLLLQICTVICGFVVPKLILSSYGSAVNGLVNSITQFLSFISLMDLGVGAVVISALYKPLADKDQHQIDCIVTSSDKFFRMIGRILLCYVVVLIATYPFLVKRDFGFVYTATLIAAISISSFSQFYFGMTDRLVLTADQRGYIQYNAQTITLVLNTVACAVLIKLGCSIHIVKLTTSLIYLARPVFLRAYINRNYCLNRKSKYEEEPIKQKWNGIAQHISAVVLNDTDTVVLTALSTLSAVSIYSVYNLVVSGLKKLFESATNGVEAALGEAWAKKEYGECNRLFSFAEWFIHTSVTYVFTCTALLVVPFVEVYTKGINDAAYAQPLFAVLIVLAHTMHCYRLPYHIMVKAAGRYKETQKCYFVAAILNLAVSILAVKRWGLIGVAIGTLAAMIYQTIWMVIYNSKYLINGTGKRFVKQMLINLLLFFGAYTVLPLFVSLKSVSISSWIMMAIEVAVLVAVIEIFINVIFYRDFAKVIFNKLRKGK